MKKKREKKWEKQEAEEKMDEEENSIKGIRKWEVKYIK